MSLLGAFDPALISRLEHDDPELDLEALAAEVLAKKPRNPNGLLASWARAATRDGRFRKSAFGVPGPHGHWSETGSWVPGESDERYWNAGHGSVTRFVRQLVWMRRNLDGSERLARGMAGELTPSQAADLIVERGMERAFPCYETWANAVGTRESWALVPCHTSAEAAVKLGGYGGQQNA